MSLWKRGGIWWSFFYIDGVRHQTSTETNNRRLAEQIEQKLKKEAIARKHRLIVSKPDMAFSELSARFIAEGGATAYHIGRIKELLQFFADIPVERINKGSASEYRLWRLSRKKISDATINRDLSVLRHILYWAVDSALLLDNPLGRMRLVRERRTKKRVLSLAEEVALLSQCSDHFQPIVVMALDTGMRRGELLHQQWEDVDFDRRLLYVTRSKTPEGEAREIPLTGRIYQYLVTHRAGDGVIFTYQHKPLHLIKTAWKRSLERAQVRPLRFHDLRHTFNTRLMEAGVVQDVRKALMGHSSGHDVHSAYTHVELPAKREAIRKLEAWVQAQLREQQEQNKQPVGGTNDRSEDGGIGFIPSPSLNRGGATEALEEEDPRGRRPRPN